MFISICDQETEYQKQKQLEYRTLEPSMDDLVDDDDPLEIVASKLDNLSVNGESSLIN